MKVAIIQRVLPYYRVAVYKALHAALAARGVELVLFYGQEAPGAVPKTVDPEVPWASRIRNRYLDLRGKQLVWQPCLARLRDVDLVIVAQENRLLVNYVLLAGRLVSSRRRFAFWGHGRNFQSTERDRHSEAVKRRLLRLADWCFAYTDLSARIMREQGVPPEKITVVQNTIDTAELEATAQGLAPAELASTRAELGVAEDAPIVLYCGGLKASKKIELLLQACEAARARSPSMHLVVIGDGPEEHKVRAAAARHPWIHAVGPVFGPSRVRYFAISEALLMPVSVGLVVIDAFATRTPLITTDVSSHGPEAGYLEHEVNGLISAPSLDAYADAIVRYLGDASLRARLRDGCASTARRYTLDNMVERVASGIVACLGAEAARPRDHHRTT